MSKITSTNNLAEEIDGRKHGEALADTGVNHHEDAIKRLREKQTAFKEGSKRWLELEKRIQWHESQRVRLGGVVEKASEDAPEHWVKSLTKRVYE